MKASQPILPILTLKLIAMATSTERSEKEGKISYQRSSTYHMVKISPVDRNDAVHIFAYNSRVTGPKFTKFYRM